MNHRYLLWLGFDGSLFHGLAKAGGHGYGAMDLIIPVMSKIFGEMGIPHVSVHPGSRTDANVHVIRAPCLVNLYNQPEKIKVNSVELVRKANSFIQVYYPNSAKVLDFHPVSPGFHVRHHAIYRRYIYRLRSAKTEEIYQNCVAVPSLSCFAERHHCWSIRPEFDIHRANKACELFQGTHNMASFFKFPSRYRDPNVMRPPTVRTIDLCRVVRGEPISGMEDENFDYYNFEVVAKSFLREQVSVVLINLTVQIRRMIRIVVKCGYDEYFLNELEIMLRCPDPSTFLKLGHRAAHGKGLYLCDVVYDPKDFVDPYPYYPHTFDNVETDEDEPI